MSISRRVAFFFGWAVALLLGLSPNFALATDEETETENVCITCHSELEDILQKVVFDWKKSVHAEAGITCDDCHGGNPDDMAEAMEPDSGFKGKPAADEISRLCSNCHSDSARMRQYNLPSNQFENYSSSVHGKKVAAGDPDSPTCLSCHGGTHEIRRVADPESTVNRANVVKTCAGCHSNKTIMDAKGIKSDQYELYKGSVHGTRYFEGDQGVPTCVNCHLNHEIINPQNSYTRLVCVNCHIEQEEAYKTSLHWDVAQEKGSPTCIDCHSNHGIQKPTEAKFVDEGELNCRGCHAKNSLQMETASKLHAMISATARDLENAENAIRELHEWSGSGFETSHMEAKVKKVAKLYKALRTGSHVLDIAASTQKAQEANMLASEVLTEVAQRESELTRRKWGLFGTWMVFFGFSWALYNRSRLCSRD